MAAVRTEDKVVGRQMVCLSYRRRLLANRQMRRALVIVLDALVRPLLLNAVQHRLELTNVDHVPIHTH